MDLLSAWPREHRFTGYLFDHPVAMAGLIVAYLAVSLKIGPDFMRDRKPYNLRSITRLYNLVQVASNVWFCSWAYGICWRHWYSGCGIDPCGPPTYEEEEIPRSDDTPRTFFFSTFYFYVRIFDFLDTIFFVLAKKFNHVSFLHVYHHVMVVSSVYIYLRHGWANTIFHIGILNSTVHVVMYTYYFLATFPAMRPYLWWKRYITTMQITQFLIMGVHMMYLTFSPSCQSPRMVINYNLVQIFLMILLFGRFYVKSYLRGGGSDKRSAVHRPAQQKLNVD